MNGPDTSWQFDIERAISTWRQFISRDPAIRPADLDELEIHLRDAWEDAVRNGMAPAEAFEKARDDLGNIAALSASYRDVHVEKIFRRGQTRNEFYQLSTAVNHYFKSAWRNITRHRGYTFLNVTGLSMAFAAALIIGLFIRHSLSFDRFHENTDRLYRVVHDRGGVGVLARPSLGVGDYIRSEWAGVEKVVEAAGVSTAEYQFTVDNVHFFIGGVLYVDDGFLDIFAFHVLDSTNERPLAAPGSIALTRSTAERLFGGTDPLGQIIQFDADRDLTVTAILEDPPNNTHLPFNVLIRGFTEPSELSWNYVGYYTYVLLKSGASPGDLADHLNSAYTEANPGAISSFSLQPVTDIHLHSSTVDGYAAAGDVRYLFLFGSIGILILFLACINYMNLATARSTKRTREVGVRKVVGASAAQLRSQFLVDSLLLTISSVPIALFLVTIALPLVNQMSGESLTIEMLNDPMMWVTILTLVGLVSFGAGLYPAVLMARQNPVDVFSGNRSSGRGRNSMRRILVGLQVSISFAMIVITLVISGQLNFIRTENLGFDYDQVITLSPRDWSIAQFNGFKSEILSHSSVRSAALGAPLGVGWRYMSWKKTLEDGGIEVDLEMIYVGTDFMETMDLEFIEGRSFGPEDLASDPTPMIVTESYAKVIGNGSSVLGTSTGQDGAGPIIGVVRDFRNTSFSTSGRITLFQLEESSTRNAVVKLASSQISRGLDVIRTAWNKVSPDRPFVYRFLDDRIQAQYLVETRLGTIFKMFTGLSIVIAVLGLFGLASLTAKQRDKEIGIRKSLGASEADIVMLLTREFLLVVLVGVAVASPLAYIYSARWLSDFTDHIPLGVTIFGYAALICFVFVLGTVGYHAIRAARTNPVDALSWD